VKNFSFKCNVIVKLLVTMGSNNKNMWSIFEQNNDWPKEHFAQEPPEFQMILNLDRSVNSLNEHVSRLGLGLMHRSVPHIICSTANRVVMFTGISTLSNNILCSNNNTICCNPVILRVAIIRQRIPRCVNPILWTRPRPVGTSYT